MYRVIGKFLGFSLGLAVAGWGGSLMGLLLGHLYDLKKEKQRLYLREKENGDLFPEFQIDKTQRPHFDLCVITLGAKLAKCDGPVSKVEIAAFQRAFRSRPLHLERIGALFDQARKTSDGYEPYAARLAQILNMRQDILEDVLAGLFYIAKIDSHHLSRAELLFLRRVGTLFGFNESDFIRTAARAGVYLTALPPEPKRDAAFDVLGLPTTATNDVIKKTYKTLVRKYHPDKLMAAGLSPAQVAEASEKVKRINAAYADICKKRKIK